MNSILKKKPEVGTRGGVLIGRGYPPRESTGLPEMLRIAICVLTQVYRQTLEICTLHANCTSIKK